MMMLARFVFQYGQFVLLALMVGWIAARYRGGPLTGRMAFRLMPLVFAALILGRLVYAPALTISSPANHTIVHPGDQVTLKIDLRPEFMAALYPFVGLSFYSCYDCAGGPPSISAQGSPPGFPYTYTVQIPKTVPPGEMFVGAYASAAPDQPAGLRATAVGLVVQ